MKTRKLISAGGVVLLSLSALAACSSNSESNSADSGKTEKHKYSLIVEDAVMPTIPEGWDALVAALDEAVSEIPNAVQTAKGRSAWVAKWQYEPWEGKSLNMEYDSYEMGDCYYGILDENSNMLRDPKPCTDLGREKIEQIHSNELNNSRDSSWAATYELSGIGSKDIWHLKGEMFRSEDSNGTAIHYYLGDATPYVVKGVKFSDFLRLNYNSQVPVRTDGTFTPADFKYNDPNPLSELLELAVHLQEPDVAIPACNVNKSSVTCFLASKDAEEPIYEENTPISVTATIVNPDLKKMCLTYAAKPDNSISKEDCDTPGNVSMRITDFTPNELINDFGASVSISGPEESHLDWTGHQDIIAPWSKK